VSSSNVFLPDDSGNQSTDVNPSYFAPAYYKAFQTASGQSRWGMVADQTYTMLNKCANASTGLVPDWCVQSSGAPSTSRGATGATYGYDAARTPFRIALDACWNADTRAVTYLAKVGAFFNGVTAPSIVDGYNLDGTQAAGMRYPAIAAFVGPAGVSGMPAKLDQLMRSAYGRVIGVTDTGTSSAYNYYNASWGILTEMLMTGNFVNLAAL
jgi:endo-1,4-beta-D-glucanase Y